MKAACFALSTRCRRTRVGLGAIYYLFPDQPLSDEADAFKAATAHYFIMHSADKTLGRCRKANYMHQVLALLDFSLHTGQQKNI